jgi:hypothetical protein
VRSDDDPRSPIPDIRDIRKRVSDIFEQGMTGIPGIDLNEEYQLSLLDTLRGYRKKILLKEVKTE